MKRLFKSLLVLAIIVAACIILNPLKAQAASNSDLEFELNDDGNSYYVSGCNQSASGTLSIPAIYKGKPVTAIGEMAFHNCCNLTSVNINGNVTTIGKNAFYYCTSLATVNMGSAVITIGYGAFSDCRSLSGNGLSIPDSVTTIGDYAFYDCDNLGYINIPNGVTTIGEMSFSGCDILKKVTIGTGVTTIGDYAFSNCTNLSNMTIGNSVAAIGSGAFSGCKALSNVVIPDSVITIDSTAFYNCTSLTNLTIGEKVTTIGNSAFCYCTSLTSVTVPDSVTAIGNNVFSNCTNLTSVTFGKNVATIGTWAFSNCKALANVTIPNRVTAIGEGTFSGCEGLTNVTIPDSVTAIGDYAFNYCYSLTNVTMSNSITSIGASAFNYCFRLTSITIPGSVTSIGGSAFRDCSKLANVYYGGTQEQWNAIEIGTNNDPLLNAKLHFPDPCADGHTEEIIPGKAPTATETGLTEGKKCSVCGEILVAQEEIPVLPAEVTEGPMTLKLNADATGYYVASCSTSVAGEVVIPATVNGLPVTAIGDNAFKNCGGLTGVSIPGSVTTIGDHGIYNCDKLVTITVPEGVTSIGPYGISYCDALKEINLPSTLVTIGNNAFAYDKVLVTMNIPEGVTTIGDNAFRYCWKMTSISLPATLTTLGYKVFSVCDVLETIQVAEGNPVYCSVDNVLYGGNMTQLIRANVGLAGKYTIPEGVQRIEDFAFDNCAALTDIVIPDSVTYIGECAFSGCSGVKTVTLGVGVATIGKEAFRSCTGMTDVYYNGTQAQQNGVSIADNNTPLLNAIWHFTDTCAESHTYDNDFDASCNVCGEVRQTNNTYKFENYRVVFSDTDTTHTNFRAVIYKLGDKTVADPTNETALKAIDPNAVTKWGIGDINKILLTDAGNYVVLLKYNVGTGSAVKVPLVISVSTDPKLIIDKNNKITAIDNSEVNINHRVVVYYLGDQTVEDIYDVAALEAIDAEPETIWKIKYINRLALIKGGNYVLHLCYNEGISAKITVAQQFTVESIPTLSVDINNKIVVAEENVENKNHRAVVYYLGETEVEDPYDEAAVKAAAVSTSKTYWGLADINKVELKEGGNYVIHLYYNVGTSDKRTLALDIYLNERPVLTVDEDGKINVSYTDPEIGNARAYIYNVGDAEIADIYDEAALKAIATPTQVWGLSSINKKTLTPGTYVIHFYYSVGTSAKKTVALKVTV